MTKNITVLLIEDSSDYAELVQQWLAPRPDITFTLNWTDTLEAGLRRLEQGGVDAVLMDLGLPDSDGLETFLRLQPRAAGIPVIVLSAGEGEALAIRTVQEGAQDYLVKSACSAEALVRALRYAILRQTKQQRHAALADAPEEASRVIGVLGASGGAGATTVACHVALELAAQTGQQVLLADLDLQGGVISFLMQLDSPYSMLDAIENLDRLDADCWKGLVASVTDDLDVLGSALLLGKPEPDPVMVGRVIDLARSFYHWIVLDLGGVDAFSFNLLDKTNEILLVTGGEVPALYQARRIVQALSATVLEKDRLRLILNQSSERLGLPTRDVEQIFGTPLYATLPADPSGMRHTQSHGKFLNESSPLRERIAELAGKVAGLDPKKSRRWTSLSALNPFSNGKRQKDLQSVDS